MGGIPTGRPAPVAGIRISSPATNKDAAGSKPVMTVAVFHTSIVTLPSTTMAG